MKSRLYSNVKSFFIFVRNKTETLDQIFMIGCYIIHSDKLSCYYIGATQEDVYSRLEKHNNGSYGKSKFTSTANDWLLVLFIPANDFAHAVRIEKRIKSMKSSIYIRNLTKFPELLEKLVSSS